LGANVLIFRSPDGGIIWGDAYALDDKSKLEGLAAEIGQNVTAAVPEQKEGETTAISGMLKTSKGLVLVASAPLLRTDRTGPSTGTVIVATLLDEAAVHTLTGVEFSIADFSATDRNYSDTPASVTQDDAVETTSLLSDINGAPLALVTTKTPRDVSKAGASAIHSAILHMVGAALAVVLALWLSIRLIVVSRIEALKNHFAMAGATGRIAGTEREKSNDEIGKLAQSFNGMAEQVNSLRDALADSAYLTGVSEWAAGTLHNVRNSLSPINLNALKIQDLFRWPWLKNVKNALDELRSDDTSAERRGKLAAYIVSKVPLMLESSDRAITTSQEIETASKVLEDIVAEYERYSRHETVSEEVELRPLIEALAKSEITAHNPDIAVTISSARVHVAANRTILRQILSNVFKNALESMQDNAREKRVDVEFVEGDSDRVKIRITDTGHGIAPDHLKSMFTRGFSTRTRRTGGLGLHWCANAAQSMGGSLEAESKGLGTGATLVLTLPAAIKSLKDAA
jgi:signal transduction histidine kinase